MKNSLVWRGLLILGVAVMAVFGIYPPKEKINLGLDLQGGIHLVLRVETADALRAETGKDLEFVEKELQDKGATTAHANRTGDSSFELMGVPAEQETALNKTAHDYLQGWDFHRDGDRFVFAMTGVKQKDVKDSAVNQALQTIRNRIDQFGVSEPLIARQGLDSDRIVVQLPGVDDPDRVKRLIKNTAFLEFRLVDYPGSTGTASRDELLAHYGGTLKEGLEVLPEDVRDKQGRLLEQHFFAVERRQVITGRELKSAAPSSGQFGEPVVAFHLTAEGAKRFGDATGANVGRGLAIVLDGKVVSAPRINSRITDSGIIEGNFTVETVQDLVTTLRSGALPAGITYLEDRTVGPSLGQDSIDKGLKAGLIGSVLVALMMLVVYRFSGVNAILVLALNIFLIFGGLGAFHATLTLPGIAGIVLTIGMSVDAAVLVFERIKEELRSGKTIKGAIDAGFKNAFTAIIDTHATQFLSALLLFQFGTGPVRGFAVTLSIGILGTLFCFVFVSRWLFDLKYSRNPKAETLSI